ncbi:MAG: hypothetical protein JNM31_10700 [Flavobacteriales bacterium]|nr:hypothetical protein [Flavobacteriales bacterium]
MRLTLFGTWMFALLWSGASLAQQGIEHRLVLNGLNGPVQAKLLYEALHGHPGFRAADTQLEEPGHALVWLAEERSFEELRGYLAPYGFELIALLFRVEDGQQTRRADQGIDPSGTPYPSALVAWLAMHPEYTDRSLP